MAPYVPFWSDAGYMPNPWSWWSTIQSGVFGARSYWKAVIVGVVVAWSVCNIVAGRGIKLDGGSEGQRCPLNSMIAVYPEIVCQETCICAAPWTVFIAAGSRVSIRSRREWRGWMTLTTQRSSFLWTGWCNIMEKPMGRFPIMVDKFFPHLKLITRASAIAQAMQFQMPPISLT